MDEERKQLLNKLVKVNKAVQKWVVNHELVTIEKLLDSVRAELTRNNLVLMVDVTSLENAQVKLDIILNDADTGAREVRQWMGVGVDKAVNHFLTVTFGLPTVQPAQAHPNGSNPYTASNSYKGKMSDLLTLLAKKLKEIGKPMNGADMRALVAELEQKDILKASMTYQQAVAVIIDRMKTAAGEGTK